MTKELQIEAIRKFLGYVLDHGDLFEVRALGSEKYGTMRWLGDRGLGAAQAAVAMEGRGGDVYYSLNPIYRDSTYAILTTQNYPYIHVRFTMTDRVAACRNLYLIDIDPVRPSGVASTDEQRADAAVTADGVQAYLTSNEWPEPIRIDSGNGIHLLYKGDRCSADGGILKFALRALAQRFDGNCKVDQSVFNAARIARLPYTWNRKAGRPSSVLSYPCTLQPLPAGRIFRLALEGGYQFDYGQSRRTGGTLAIETEGLRRLIAEFPQQLHLDRVSERDGITYFSLSSCPFKGAPHRNQSVGAGKTTIMLRPDSIGFSCFSDKCTDHTFADLLRLVHTETGRWPSMQIWDDDLEALEARWGGIDHVTGESPEEEYQRLCFEEGTWDAIPDEVVKRYRAAGHWSVNTATANGSPTVCVDDELRALIHEAVERVQAEREAEDADEVTA